MSKKEPQCAKYSCSGQVKAALSSIHLLSTICDLGFCESAPVLAGMLESQMFPKVPRTGIFCTLGRKKRQHALLKDLGGSQGIPGDPNSRTRWFIFSEMKQGPKRPLPKEAWIKDGRQSAYHRNIRPPEMHLGWSDCLSYAVISTLAIPRRRRLLISPVQSHLS